jgi:hypothetical protein
VGQRQMSALLRGADDRGWRQREGPLKLHGHANISITLVRYGHLMPGNEEEAAELSMRIWVPSANARTKRRGRQKSPARRIYWRIGGAGAEKAY